MENKSLNENENGCEASSKGEEWDVAGNFVNVGQLVCPKGSVKPLSAESYRDLLGTMDDVYEYIPDGRPVKLYFDVDLGGENVDDFFFNDPPLTEEDREKKLDWEDKIYWAAKYAMRGIKHILAKYAADIVPEVCHITSHKNNFLDWKKKTPIWKVSHNFVVNNILATKAVQKALVMESNKYMMGPEGNDNGDIYYHFKKGKDKVFDEGVYGVNNKIRAIGTSKPSEDRPKVLSSDRVIEDVTINGAIECSIISAFIPVGAHVLDLPVGAPVEVKNGGGATISTDDQTAVEQGTIDKADYDMVAELIENGLLDAKSIEFEHWRDAGWAIANKFGEAGWALFDAFSQRCTARYVAYEVRDWWEKYAMKPITEGKKPLTLGSVIKWACDCNSEETTRIQAKYNKQKQRRGKAAASAKKRKAAAAVDGNENCDDPEKADEDDDEDASEGIEDHDKGAARKVFELYPHWVYCNKDLYVFDNTTGLWENTEVAHFKVITNFDHQLRLVGQGKDGKQFLQSRGYGNTTTLIRQLIPHLKFLHHNDQWLDEKENSSLGKLLFKNGYYDFRLGQFHLGFDPNIYFAYRIQSDFREFDEDDLLYMKSIEERLFTLPLGDEVGDYLILNLARALAGDQMKRILFGLGGTDCGKSVITKACKSAMGQYFGSFNAECLAYNNNSTADEGQKMRWALIHRFRRLIISNEVKTGSKQDGNMIKKLSSGGDACTGRQHCREEVPFTPHFLVFCLSNDLNKISPYDEAVSNRVRVTSFTRSFQDCPSNEYELKKDVNIDKEIETPRFRRMFLGMLIKRYVKFNTEEGRTENEPAECVNAKGDWIGRDEDMGPIPRFLQDFELTDSNSDHVPSSQIEDWVKQQKLGISTNKFLIELKKHAKINNLCNVRSEKKREGIRTIRVWYGVRDPMMAADTACLLEQSP